MNCGNCHKCYQGAEITLGNGETFKVLDRMLLCPLCGNKRCPKATDHDLPCSGSNEPGQKGSCYA